MSEIKSMKDLGLVSDRSQIDSIVQVLDVPVNSDTPGSGHFSIMFVTVFMADRQDRVRWLNPMSVMASGFEAVGLMFRLSYGVTCDLFGCVYACSLK